MGAVFRITVSERLMIFGLKPSINARRPIAFLTCLALAFLVTGCGNPSSSPDYIPTGELVVNVRDLSGAPVAGASVQVLDGTTSFLWRQGTSGADGVVVFKDSPDPGRTGLLGGSYRVNLTPSAGYAVAPGQANPATIQIRDKRTTTLTMQLAKNP